MRNSANWNTTWFARSRLVRGIAIGVVAVGVAGTIVLAVTPVNGGTIGGTTTAVDTSAGEQIDPHVSGDLAAYTDMSTGSGVIRYYDFLNPGASGVVPLGDVWDVDELSNVDGNHIAFARQHADGSRSCMVFDRATSSTTEIGPGQGAMASLTALGSDTVAFVNSALNAGDIMVGKISDPLAPLVNLSNSSRRDGSPAVSPFGDAVVWESCEGAFFNCDVMKATRSGGVWGGSSAVSDTTAAERNPDTDGISVAYDSNRAGTLGGSDVFFQPLAGGTEVQVALDGLQRNPSISGGVIAFESKAPGATTWDLFVYQVSTNTLFQLTDTPSTNEILNDVTTLANGDIRVVWAADDDFFPGEHNIYARTFTLPQSQPEPQPAPSFHVCLLYDPTRVVRSGATLPIKIQLCNANGANQSSSSIVVTAGAVRMVNSVMPPTAALDTGNANPDSNFRFDPTLGGSGGYIFNLSTRGLASGTYALAFTATGDSTTHEVRFAVK